MKFIFLFFFLFLLGNAVRPLHAQNTLEARSIVTDLNRPWEIIWGPDNWIWVTELNGRVSRVNPETGEQVLVVKHPNVGILGRAGLLGMALHQGNNGTRVFLLVNELTGNGPVGVRLRLVRYDYDGDSLIHPVYLIDSLPVGQQYPGGVLKISEDKLYIGVGYGSNLSASQDLNDAAGKVLRVNLDGSVPEDNPFPDAPFPTNLVWSWGHSNPQGLEFASNGSAYLSENNDLFGSDDEINVLEKGGNYGWSNVSGYCDSTAEQKFCEDSSVVEPLYAWTTRPGVGGLEYYAADRFPNWKNSLLIAGFAAGELVQLKLAGDGRSVVEENTFLTKRWGELRDLCVSPDGRVFLVTNVGGSSLFSGRILELYYREDPLPAISTPVFDPQLICEGSETQFTFTLDGEFEPDNVFSLAMVPADDSTATIDIPAIVRIAWFNESTTGGTFSTNILNPLSGFRYRIFSSNPFSMSPPTEPVESFRPPALAILHARPASTLCSTDDTLTLAVANVPPDVEYLWSDGSKGAELRVTDSGVYSVMVTWPNGCVYSPNELRIQKGAYPELSLNAESLSFCDGDSVTLTVSGTPGASLRWSNGVNDDSVLVVKSSGSYWVLARSPEGCVTYSDTLEVVKHDNPFVPEITRDKNRLIAGPAASYQWYRDGTEIPGATEQIFEVVQNGIYMVEVRNPAGCSTFSDTIEMIVTGVQDETVASGGLRVYPQPAGDELTIEFNEAVSGRVLYRLTNMLGEEVGRQEERVSRARRGTLSLRGLPSGAYHLQVETRSGSRSVNVVKK